MRQVVFLLLVVYAKEDNAQNNFVLDSVDMTDAVYEQCSYCDERSDRAGSRAVADALREYMSRNHINILLEQDEVKVQDRFPDQAVDTGHSCSKTAETKDIVAKAWMIPGTARLGADGVAYDDLIKLAFAANDVDHQVEVDMSIRVYFGAKLFGKCKRVGRKTCHGVKGFSKGTNHVIVVMQASNVLTECIGDQEHLTFKVDVKVQNIADEKSYPPVTANDQKCDAKILGLRIAELKVSEYANQYLKRNKFRELRGTKLVKELENKLKTKLGSTISIPITTSGKPRSCPRFKREVNENKERCTKKKTCPSDFTRMGNQDICGKYFGFKKPNCNTYGSNAAVFTKSFGGQTLYWCTTPMV